MAFLDSIANVPRLQKVVAGVVGLVVVAGLGYFLLISPKIGERSTLRQQNEALRTEVRKAQADEANLRPFRAQADALRKRLQAAKERLPSEKEMPRLYRQLTDIAFQSGLQVALSDFMANLKASGRFKDVDLVDAKQDLSKSPRTITFEVTCRFEI